MRTFEPFDRETVNKELRALPTEDFLKLTEAMKMFQAETGVGYSRKSYPDGIEMLTDSGTGQGRCLFFFFEGERMVVLGIYKKESPKLPLQVRNRILERRRRFLERGHGGR